jgi:hypothetical protein
MDTKEKLQEALKDAMRSGDPVRKRTLRSALAEIKNAEIEQGEPLEDSEILNVLQKEVKARRETIEGAEKADRQDLIEKAQQEIEVLEKYLPEPLSESELREIVQEAIQETDADSLADIGKVMGKVMPRIRGRAEGKDANRIVRDMLG